MYDEDSVKIGKSIKKQRIKYGLSQAKLAKKLLISQTHLSNIENGRVFANTKLLIKISKILKCSMDEIFDSEINSSSEKYSLKDFFSLIALFKVKSNENINS